MTSRPCVAVVGGGASGLAFAHYVARDFPSKVTLYEAKDTLGGWVKTTSTTAHHGDHDAQLLFECGPRSLRAAGAGQNTLQLIEELGLENEVIGADRMAGKRFLYSSRGPGGVQALSLWGLLSPLLRPHLTTIVREALRPGRPPPAGDETIASFASRRFSPALARDLFDPLISGIYAGDIEYLSLRATLPMLAEMEERRGSVLRALVADVVASKDDGPTLDGRSDFARSVTGIFSFKQGLRTLTDALRRSAEERGADVRPATAVTAVDLQGDGSAVVHTAGGEGERFDRVVLSTPAPTTAAILRAGTHHPTLRERVSAVAETLASMRMASVAVVHVAYEGDVVPNHLKGFGYLVPSGEKQANLGVVFDSCAFPQHDAGQLTSRMTVMMGGVHAPHIPRLADGDIERLACEALVSQLGIKKKPFYVHVVRAMNAIPQYAVGHKKTVEGVRETLRPSGVSLLGSSYGGVSVNDCIKGAQDLSRSWRR